MTQRLVLDTNIVLSALLFGAGRLSWIRQAWQHQRLQPVVCRDTVNELLRALAYPKFRLSPQERTDLLGEFLPWTRAVALPTPWPDLPACRDEKDQVFLVLAYVAGADAVVTGDGDLLAMRGTIPCRILTADELALQMKA
ncbi:MAG: putative toxin-antitoxin system toxin component, PIN family [Burkholderiaceae bacterium]